MAQSEPEQNRPYEAGGIACDRCGEFLTPSTTQRVHRSSSDVSNWRLLPERERAQLIASAAWSEAARDPNLLALCMNCHREVDGGPLRPLWNPDATVDLSVAPTTCADTLLQLAVTLLKPTREQVAHGDLHARNVMLIDTESRVIDFALSAATFSRWHQVAHKPWQPLCELGHWRLAFDNVAPPTATAAGSRDKPALVAAELASTAAHNAWSAAVELRQLYLSPDPNMSVADRNRAVSEFATNWLGWKANVPEEKTEALVDALLSDEWPSELGDPDDNVSTLVRGLVRERHRNWRPLSAGKIRGKSIISHSIQVRTEHGELAELLDLLSGPDLQFGVEPHVALVRTVLAELDPIEREVCLTYATCSGRRSWQKAARLNGLPAEFGVNRVRRKIKGRLQKHVSAGRGGRRVIAG